MNLLKKPVSSNHRGSSLGSLAQRMKSRDGNPRGDMGMPLDMRGGGTWSRGRGQGGDWNTALVCGLIRRYSGL